MVSKMFPWNSKYEIIYGWFASFVVIYTIMELKSWHLHGRNPEQGRVAKTTLQSAWQVLKVAFLFPILGKVLPRDFSPLKPVLVEGVWD